MKHEEIINLLRDDKEYYGGIGKQYLSNSDIGVLLSNPKDYGKYRADNKSFSDGRYFHQLILEPDKALDFKFVDTGTRLTKEYKEFIKDNNLPFCMLKKEKDEIENLVRVMTGNLRFFEQIYKDGNQYEVPSIKEIQGMMWKGKADIITDECIIDLKTTSDINKFKWSAKTYNYDSQCYIYQQLFGKPLVFYVVDKLSQQLGIYTPTENFILGGEQKVAKAIEVYNKYFGGNPTDNINNHFIEEDLF
jgi:hypothetical protein